MTKLMTDIEMMKDDGGWPLWPRLPLMSKDGERRCGFLICGNGSVVYAGNVYEATPNELKGVQYASFEVLAEMWRVD